MQTFLPYASFSKSAFVLDNRRLNKQITECKQIWIASVFGRGSWANHPAVRMWKGYENYLIECGYACYQEWQDRFDRKERGGRKCHNVGEEFTTLSEQRITDRQVDYPDWFGRRKFHSAHRSALLAKLPEWYAKWQWEEEPRIEYWWPV